MNDIIFKTFIPKKLLQPYISKIFVFESKFGIPKSEFSMIAPSGEMKLVIPYKNNMHSTIGNIVREHKESSCFVIGLGTKAAIIECDIDYGNLCVLFKPLGSYRFFNFSLSEITNQIFDTYEIFNKVGRELQERVAEITGITEKVFYVEEFLVKQLVSLNKSDPITEYAINKITARHGLINVSELSEEMGYSRRYLLSKFTENVGLSPKEFTSIIRFNEIYKRINLNNLYDARLYELYYDQSHFIKEFKKFTGLTPKEYLDQSNKIGNIFFTE